MQSLVQRFAGKFADPAQMRPGDGLWQAHATGAVRQAKAQQVGGVGDPTTANQSVCLAGQEIEVEIGGQARQQIKPVGVGGRCGVGHLRQESYRAASGQELFSTAIRYLDAYAVKPGDDGLLTESRTVCALV